MGRFAGIRYVVAVVLLLLLALGQLPPSVRLAPHAASAALAAGTGVPCATCVVTGSAAGGSANGVALGLTTACNTLGAVANVTQQGPGYRLTAPDYPGIAATGRVTCTGTTVTSVGTMSGFDLVLNNVVTIHATMAQAQATTTCGATSSGSAVVTHLTVNGVPLSSSFNGSAVNQTMTLPDNQGTLTVNEQIISGSSITVNALHVHTANDEDIILGTATAPAAAGCPTVQATSTPAGSGAPATPTATAAAGGAVSPTAATPTTAPAPPPVTPTSTPTCNSEPSAGPLTCGGQAVPTATATPYATPIAVATAPGRQ
jgi:hypothetical protein